MHMDLSNAFRHQHDLVTLTLDNDVWGDDVLHCVHQTCLVMKCLGRSTST